MKTDHMPVITCRRILAGTLYTNNGIKHQVIITRKGSSYKLEPFDGEIHSTIFSSRVALIDSSLIGSISRDDLTQKEIDKQYQALKATLTEDRLSPADITILSLDPGPALVTIVDRE